MKKSASILDYAMPSLDPAVWDGDMRLFAFQKDFILRLMDQIFDTYSLKQPEVWLEDIVIIGSLTTNRWLSTSDMDVHARVNLDHFIATNMPGVSQQEAFDKLDAIRKEFDRAKILAPMTRHSTEFYFESIEFKPSTVTMVGVYSLKSDSWLKEPVIFEADLDFEESKKDVIAQAEALAEELDGSLGKIQRNIQRVDELEAVINAWGPEKQQLFYGKVEQKLKSIEEEILKDLKIKQDLVDARHENMDATSEIEVKFKWLAKFGFFGILSNLKTLLEQTGGKITTQELPLVDKIISEGSIKEAFLKEAFEEDKKLLVDFDRTLCVEHDGGTLGEPISGAKEALAKLKQQGFEIEIYSVRANDEKGLDDIKEWLDKNNIPYDSIFQGEKPRGTIIDDHAISFKGDWPDIIKQVEKSEKIASLSIVTTLNTKYWIDPSGQEFDVSNKLGHYGWICQNILKEKGNVTWETNARLEEKATEMIGQGWIRITNETDGGSDFAVEVADLKRISGYLDDFISKHYSSGGIELDDLNGNYIVVADPFPTIQRAVNRALVMQKRMQENRVSKAFSKRDIIAADNIYKAYNPQNPDYPDTLCYKDPTLEQLQNLYDQSLDGLRYFVSTSGDMWVWDALELIHQDVIDQLGYSGYKDAGILDDKNFKKFIKRYYSQTKQAKTKKIKQGEYGAIMALVSHDIAQEIVEWGVRNIKDSDVFSDKNNSRLGRELEPHVTVKYGLLEDNPKTVRRFFNNEKPFKAKLGKVRHFEPPEMDFDVVTVEVISEDLEQINKKVTDHFKCADGLVSDEYHPHVTISYVKRGKGKEYIGYDGFEGKEIILDTLVISPRKGNRTYFSIGSDKESSFVLEKIDKQADFLPSLFQAPDNRWQFEHGGDDKEIALNPDAVDDDTTLYGEWWQDKPRNPSMWAEFISMFKQPFSKKEEMTIDSAYDPEMDEKEKEELGLDQTQLEYSKGFYDPKKHDFPHNTQWFQNYQGVQEPDKVTPVTYSPEMNPEFDKQNSPGGFPNRFCRKPESEWFSDEGEIVPALQNMWKYRESTLNNITRDITADLSNAYWIDPNGKVFQVRGSNFGTTYTGKDTHDGWIQNNLLMLKHDYGIEPYEDNFGKHLGSWDLIDRGWIRIGDSHEKDWGVSVKDLNNIPSSVDNLLAQFSPEGAKIEIDDRRNQYEVIEWPVKSVQQAVNKARLQPVSFSKKDLEKVAITRQYALYVGGRLAIRTLTHQKAIKVCQERFPEYFTNGNYEIKEEAYKVSKQASLSWNKNLFKAWKNENKDFLNEYDTLNNFLGKDAENLPEKEIDRLLYLHGEDLFNEKLRDLQSLGNQFPIYRVITVKDPQAFLKALENNQFKGFSGVGVYWSYDPEAAEAHWGNFDSGYQKIQLAGIVHISEINWENTVLSNMNLNLGENEKEITLLQGAALQINSVEINGEEIQTSFPVTATLNKQAGSQSASVPDYLCDEWKTEQINNDTDEEPYVNHDQRDYPYGYEDAPQDTTDFNWPKDNERAVVRLDTLENPAYRLDPFGIGEYNITWYTSLPADDGIEKMNPK